jgi:flagellar capping protein FliD
MPPTTTEVNADLKGVQHDLNRLELSTAERIGEVKSALGVIAARLNIAIGIASFLVVSTAGFAIKGLMDSAYWAGSVNTSIKALDVKYDERFKQVDTRFDRLEANISERFSKVEAKIDRMEATLAKIVDQTRPLTVPTVPRTEPPAR